MDSGAEPPAYTPYMVNLSRPIVICDTCLSANVVGHGLRRGIRRYRCRQCNRVALETQLQKLPPQKAGGRPLEGYYIKCSGCGRLKYAHPSDLKGPSSGYFYDSKSCAAIHRGTRAKEADRAEGSADNEER